jgi:hypothetical protein
MATEKLSPESFPAKAKPKRAALYCRVSTDDQHLETQLYDLREFARQRGFEIVNEYTDTISGAKSKRPALDQLLADARRNRFEIVIVSAFDRLARNVRHFLEVLDEFNHLNITFISLRENIDTAGHWDGPWWLLSERLRNWKEALSSSGFEPECVERNWKADESAGHR